MIDFIDIDEFFINKLILTSFNPELDLIYTRLSKSQVLLIKEKIYRPLMEFDSMLVLHYYYRRRCIVILFNNKDIKEKNDDECTWGEEAFNTNKLILDELGIEGFHCSELYLKLKNPNQLKSAEEKFNRYDIENTNVYIISSYNDLAKPNGNNQINNSISAMQQVNERYESSDRRVTVETVNQNIKEKTFEIKPDSDIEDNDECICFLHLSIFKKSIAVSSNFSTGKEMSTKIATTVAYYLDIHSKKFVDRFIDNRIDIIHDGAINKSQILNNLFMNDGSIIKHIISDIEKIFKIKNKIILSVNSSESNIDYEEEE